MKNVASVTYSLNILVIAQQRQNMMRTNLSSDDLTMNFSSTSANFYKLNLLKRQLEKRRMQEAKILGHILEQIPEKSNAVGKKSHAARKTRKKPLASITNDLNSYKSSTCGSANIYKLNLIGMKLNENQKIEMKKMKTVPMERQCVNRIAKNWNGSMQKGRGLPASSEEIDLPRGMVTAMRDRLEKDERNNNPRKQVDDQRPSFSQMRARWLKECGSNSNGCARTSNCPSSSHPARL